jgi:hypothetical protein
VNNIRWTKREDDLICRLRGGGADFETIAAKLPGRTPRGVELRAHHLIATGRLASKRAAWSPEEDELLCQLRAANESQDAIAARFPNRTQGAVSVRMGYLVRQGRIDARWTPIHERRPWTRGEESVLLKLRAEGATLEEIAERLPGRTFSAVARHVTGMVEDGVIAPGAHAPLSRRPWSREEDELVGGMRQAGKTPQQIAHALGRTVPSVKSRIAQRVRKGETALLRAREEDH